MQDLTLNGNSMWYAGGLDNVRVTVKPGADLLVPTGQSSPGNPNPGSPRMKAAVLDIEGSLTWNGRNVTASPSETGTGCQVVIKPNASFNIAALNNSWGAADPNDMLFKSEGTITVSEASNVAKLKGKLLNHGNGKVTHDGRLLEVTGHVIQHGSADSYVDVRQEANLWVNSYGAEPLYLRGGKLIGGGKVTGSVMMGDAGPANGLEIAPRQDNGSPGTLDITAHLHIQHGTITVDITGSDKYDRVTTEGYAALSTTGSRAVGVLNGNPRFAAKQKLFFLVTTGGIQGDFAEVIDPAPPWAHGKDATRYWFETPPAQVMGRAAFDADGNGIFEPDLGEAPLAGVVVTLVDESGSALGTDVTDADGRYDFGAVPYGTYRVAFAPPAGLEFSPKHVVGAPPDLDSDADPDTALTDAIVVDAATPVSEPRSDALFRDIPPPPNNPPVAVDDAYETPFDTTVGGNALDNDSDPDGDPIYAQSFDPPANGTVTMNPDGSFTYTPNAGFVGTDTFTYTVADTGGLTDTATVAVTVLPPSPPPPPPPALVVSGRVFNDGWEYTNYPNYWDRNGIQDAGATGYVVTVQLLNAAGAVIATTQSEGAVVGGSGYYSFTGVNPGQYRVRFGLPTSIDPRLSYRFTAAAQGSNPDLDSDADVNGDTDLFDLAAGIPVQRDAGVIWRYTYSI